MAVNFDLEQAGPEVQRIINAVDPETERAMAAEADLQRQIDEIVGGGATVGLTATPATVFVGVETVIILSATSSVNTTSITITGGSLAQPITGSGKTLNGTDALTPAEPGTTAYSAAFVISGQSRTATKNVTAVYPVYYGAGMQESDVLGVAACKASARTTPAGTYNVTVADSAKYIYFFVPANMTQIHSAKMNGFDFPLETMADTTDASGVAHKVYRTPYTQEVNTYQIVIS